MAKADANALISPYSIQSAMAMAYAGADGVTREEMARVLHYPKDDAEPHRSFAALRLVLEKALNTEELRIKKLKRGFPELKVNPLTLTVANRLFGQTGYDFRTGFLTLLNDTHAAPFVPLDFVHESAAATEQINRWVEEQTKHRIREVVPPGALNGLTRLVLVNTIYMKAGWSHPFEAHSTKPETFFVNGRTKEEVPMMHLREELAYAKGTGCSVLALTYTEGAIRFLIFLPDRTDGLAALEKSLTAQVLAASFKWDVSEVNLQLPKFKLDPPLLPLAAELQKVGMKTNFDQPPGSANFYRMAPRRPDDYLSLSQVFHKTFLNLDEQGTEAAAATVVEAMSYGIDEPKKPMIFKVDHPFLFLIQHVESGACLFLGHVTDPR